MNDSPKRYRRPDQQWKCGLQEKGLLCHQGPDYRHQCPERVCHPRRTLAWWRAYLPVALGTVTLAVLITIVNLPSYSTLVAPGPLTLSHAQLISNPEDPHRCSACHDDTIGNAPFMATSQETAMNSLSETVLAKHSQSDRCISCHLRAMPDLTNRSPHDLPTEVVSEMTAWVKRRAASVSLSPERSITKESTGDEKSEWPSWRSRFVSLISKSRPLNPSKSDTLATQDFACSTCHREHKGPNHDLQAIASGRCQACHQESFSSFSLGHPQFENYPALKPLRIAFDHRKHQDSHFTKTGTLFDCRRCHVDDTNRSSVGQVFRSRSFEIACAQCHEASILSSMSEGAIVFQVPSINIDGLAKHGVEIKDWPEQASLMMDGKVPLFMQWLLMGLDEGEIAMKDVDQDADLSKLSIDSESDRQTAMALAVASKSTIEKIGKSGQSAFEQRFVTVEGPETFDPFRRGIQEILRSAPPDLFRSAFRDWFGASQLVESPWKPLKASSHLKNGGWMIDGQRLAITYVPTGHADPWLANILEQANDLIEEQKSSGASDDRRSRVAKQLLDATSIGRCAECHASLNATFAEDPKTITGHLASAKGNMNARDRWHATRRTIAVRPLTKFDHGPHLIQPQLQSCIACHAWSDERSSVHPLQQFACIKIEQCNSCHRPQSAGDHCTQCHNYHANQR